MKITERFILRNGVTQIGSKTFVTYVYEDIPGTGGIKRGDRLTVELKRPAGDGYILAIRADGSMTVCVFIDGANFSSLPEDWTVIGEVLKIDHPLRCEFATDEEIKPFWQSVSPSNAEELTDELRYFFLIASEDFPGLGIQRGDLAFVDAKASLEDGDLVVIVNAEGHVLRRVKVESSQDGPVLPNGSCCKGKVLWVRWAPGRLKIGEARDVKATA